MRSIVDICYYMIDYNVIDICSYMIIMSDLLLTCADASILVQVEASAQVNYRYLIYVYMHNLYIYN